MKYLLSTGRTTTRKEEYILDLFRLCLGVNPGDVPYAPGFGYNFTFAGIPKAELYDKIEFRMNAFIKKISESFPTSKVTLEELSMPNEETVRATVRVGDMTTDLFVNIYENS
jgi:hypothetical protein